ncbi:MAG: DNA polymerase III subunit beta [Actinomycetes bacterium]
MKFRCDRDLLVKALSTAGRAAAAAAHSHWAGIHLSVVGDTLTAIGSDGDLLLSDTETVKGLEDGIAVVQAKIVVDVVRSLDLGMVEVESSDDWFTVRSGRSEFRLQEVPAVSYPVPAETVGEEITLATADLADGLKQVVRAASKDDSRAVLMGVKMTTEDGSLRLVSTDTFRMAIRDFPGTKVFDEGEHVIVPSRALGELARLLEAGSEVTVVLSADGAAFMVDSVRLQTKLIALEFPAYEGLLNADQPNQLTIDRVVFMDAVKRMRLMAQAETPLLLTLRSDAVELRVDAPDVGVATEEIDAKYDGEEMVIGFKPEYLYEGLELMSADEVQLFMQGPLKPAHLEAVGSQDFRYILMPQKIPTGAVGRPAGDQF